MKRLVFLTVIAILAIGTVSAQGWGWGPPPETVRAEGTLQLQNGQIVLSTGSVVYFVPILSRYIGFVEGLREGARISVEGFTSGNFMQVTKFTIGGREYDLFGDASERGTGPGWGGGPGWGRGGCPMWGGGPRGGHHWGPGGFGPGRRGRW